jgi:hypothetical protein
MAKLPLLAAAFAAAAVAVAAAVASAHSVTHFSVRCPFGGTLDALAVTLTAAVGDGGQEVDIATLHGLGAILVSCTSIGSTPLAACQPCHMPPRANLVCQHLRSREDCDSDSACVRVTVVLPLCVMCGFHLEMR